MNFYLMLGKNEMMSQKSYVYSLICLGILVFLLFGLVTPKSQGSPGTDIHITRVEGEIDAGTANHLERAIKISEKNGTPLIIELDTPGGLIAPTKDIVDQILGSEVPVVTWVKPEGAYAYSAGTFILMASDVAVMYPNSTIGAAEPRPKEEKLVNAMSEWIGQIAENQNRPKEKAKMFVENNQTYGSENAKKENMVDLVTDDREDIENYLGMSGASYDTLSVDFTSKFLGILSNPQLASILFLLGLLGVATEITTGGVGGPGVVGAIFLLLGFFGLQILEISLLGLALTSLGAVLIAAEIYEPGFGIFGIGGITSIILGLFIIGPGGEPWMSVPRGVLWGGTAVLVVIVLLLIKAVRGSMKKEPATGMETFIDAKGAVVKEIDPDGVVRVKGERWSAFSEEKIEKGEEVIVEDIIEKNGQTTLLVSTLSED